MNRSVELRRALALGVILAIGLLSPARAEYAQLRMGNPSKATASVSNKDNYLMKKPYFALSYNNGKGTPNWVSWRLDKSDLGTASRVPFYPDPDLPMGFQVVTPKDYTGSGFDRGHMCPHGDRTATDAMSRATFAMTNMIPQSPYVNQKAWNQLEIYCRDLAAKGKVLYIVDGPAGKGGSGRNGYRAIIGAWNTITVPAKNWKVIMVLNAGSGDDPRKVSRATRLIAVIMPNDMSVGDDWAPYRVPIADVEKLTGYRFFDRVPAAIIDPLKKKVDKMPIAPPAPIRRGY